MLLLILNFVSWFWPALVTRGVIKYSYFISAFLFSQSYFLLSFFVNIFGFKYQVTVRELYVEKALIYSAVAGFFYSFVFFISITRNSDLVNFGFKDLIQSIYRFIPASKYFFVFFPILLMLILYEIYKISYYFEMYDRGAWWKLGLKNKFNFSMNIYSLLVSVLVVSLFKSFIRNYFFIFFINFLLVFSIVFLVSFDGSRRELILPIIMFLFCGVYMAYNSKRIPSFLYFTAFLFFLFFINYIAQGRGVLVGWYSLFNNIDFSLGRYLTGMFSPMPTLHVTTHMLEYTEFSGYQGFGGYLNAIINTLVPRFIVGFYVAGIPVVSQLHDQLGWSGFDFGFLAENIYSGGILAVIILHSIIGFYHAFLINRISYKRFSYWLFFLLSFHLGLVQALRSDFMNLLKWSIYPAVIISVLFFILKTIRK